MSDFRALFPPPPPALSIIPYEMIKFSQKQHCEFDGWEI